MEFEEFEEGIAITKGGSFQKGWDTEELKLLIFFLIIVFSVFGYICYRNYILISTGQMAQMNRESRKNKKNKQRWDMDDI